MANIKSLTPFPKGVSGNPAGRPPNPPELKELNRLTKAELELLVTKILRAKPEELKQYNKTVLELWVSSGAAKAIQQGDFTRLSPLLDRLIGKVPDHIELETQERPVLSLVDKKIMLEKAKHHIKLLEEEIEQEEKLMRGHE